MAAKLAGALESVKREGGGSFPEGWKEPPIFLYELSAFPALSRMSCCSQDFHLTLDEFEALKKVLAKMRGYDVKEVA